MDRPPIYETLPILKTDTDLEQAVCIISENLQVAVGYSGISFNEGESYSKWALQKCHYNWYLGVGILASMGADVEQLWGAIRLENRTAMHLAFTAKADKKYFIDFFFAQFSDYLDDNRRLIAGNQFIFDRIEGNSSDFIWDKYGFDVSLEHIAVPPGIKKYVENMIDKVENRTADILSGVPERQYKGSIEYLVDVLSLS